MNITYIGLPNECGIKICNYLSLTHSVVFITNKQPAYEVSCETVISKSLWLPNYFDGADPVDTLIINDCNKEYDTLNNWLFAANERVKQIIIINQGSFYSRPQETEIGDILCKRYADNSSTEIKMLHIPALYGEQTFPNTLAEIVENVLDKGSLTASLPLLGFCDALHIEDLCTFLNTWIESEAMADDIHCHVKSGYVFPVQDLLSCIKLRYPNASYDIEIAPPQEQSDDFVCPNNWAPSHCFMDEVDSVISEIVDHRKTRKRMRKRDATSAFAKLGIFLLCFFLVEIYINFTAVASDLQFVDVRLIFIAMTAVLLGKHYSVASSLLCSAASILHTLNSGYRWYVLFFHVNNWIPLAIYILFAMIIGSCADAKKFDHTGE